ncbi:DUF2845 domain-containing protein [Amycolatopsis sp. AA4]|uniref:DUF2845 domain-containing protein n=1 Tax=Actinomycetes TaxID=1760 RepID=UPI0001DEE816|nr:MULTISPECIES: DUF2845 domain-containing protein [Actinomycetes]ATY13524.1 DUF2845 domain-containing protein [Amycolatopsis sp. AA4]EFL09483.1 predicted protein [Streptomyces sp. AA4]
MLWPFRRRTPVKVGMSKAEVLSLLGAPLDSTTREEVAGAAPYAAVRLRGQTPPHYEYWLYVGMPSGYDTQVTFTNGLVSQVTTPRSAS